MSGTIWSRNTLAVGCLLLVAVAGAGVAAAGLDPMAIEGPVAAAYAVRPAAELAATVATPLDWDMVRAEDADRDSRGLPPRFAIPESVWLTPANTGTWEDLDADHVMWRLRISAPGALSLNLGFTGYWLPSGSRLSVYPTDATGPADRRGERVFTAADNEDHGQLWTPVVLADDIVVELVVSRSGRHDFRLELTAINQGYRYFGEEAALKAGLCNVDVVCPEGDPWRSEIRSVGAISTGGSVFCTGVMMNNTARDGKPLFLTANHCNITLSNAPSLVVYWNFQSPVCGDQSGGSLDQFMTGATFLATSTTSDFTLVEMDDPVSPALGVTFAGWDRSAANPTSAVAIHHPRGDEKSISFENDPTSTSSYLDKPQFDPLAHIKITDWDVGTTEPGSSGCPLFDQNHHVVGQLHGGYAACDNDSTDYFGRLSVSWDGGGTPATRLSDYLDPIDSGAVTLDLFDPQAASFAVSPGTDAAAAGVVGGPFSPLDHVYTLTSIGTGGVDFKVTTTASWVTIADTVGTLAPDQTLDVTVTIDDSARGLAAGSYAATIAFLNLDGGGGSTSRELTLKVTENALKLVGPAPNPFTVAPVTIAYALRGPATVRASITNVRGLMVRDLGRIAGVTGDNVIRWDGRDGHGRRVPSGVYVLQLKGLGQVYRTSISYIH